MKILYTNDDGYDAIGINILYQTLKDSYKDSYLCAPLKHKSAFSHAINFYDYLEIKELNNGVQGLALDGTPADCVRSALQGLFDFKFDLVLSGINYGMNSAQDVFYSGTVGAAREASFHGVFAMAFSLDIPDHHEHVVDEEIKQLFQYSANIAKQMVDQLPRELLQHKNSIINVNFPKIYPAKGIKITTLGLHEYETHLDETQINNKRHIKINSKNKAPLSGVGTDSYHLAEGYIVVSALYKGIIEDTELQNKIQYMNDISVEI